MNKIIKRLLASTLAVGMTACSSDYLEQPPIDLVSDDAIGNSVEGARAALYGICESMFISYGADYTERFGNGEAYFQTFYGDAPSPDAAFTFLYGAQKEFQAWAWMTRDTGNFSRYAWMYGYNIINQANVLLAAIDGVPGDPAEVKFIKAQALTMRAHGYIRLMQVYGPRYEDRDNGNALCLVLRTTPGSDPAPLVTYNEVMAQIYKDFEDAIALYNESGKSRTKGFEPDINVAKGLYSRILLMNHDWAKAEQMAREAREGYPIMSAADYIAGFGTANSEWLWYNDYNKTYNGYNSWGASYSCNGAYATAYDWAGGGAISWKLYKEIFNRNQGDVRCELYWTPDKANLHVDYGFEEKDFWDSDVVYPERMNMFLVDPYMTASIALWAMDITPEGYDKTSMLLDGYSIPDIVSAVTGGALEAPDAVNCQNPQYVQTLASVFAGALGATRVQFGQQAKFWSDAAAMGDAQHPFLRAGELILTEAEAAAEQNKDDVAQNCLNELNSNRMSNYTCSLTGDALKEEIRLYRRMELWGEGDSWFSFKRWNVTAKREIWKENDPTSNNFLPAYEGTYDPSYSNGWRYEIPKSEKDYNNIINSQLNK